MTDSRYIELITAYLDGSITSAERARLNELLDSGEVDILDIKEMETLYHRMGQLPAPEPGEAVTARFYQMLEEQKQRQAPVASPFTGWLEGLREMLTVRQLGYTLGVFIAGMLIGHWATPFRDYRQQIDALSSEVSQMRQVMMMSLLDNNSATERLKAVNISTELQTADEKVARALLKTLNNDPNVNVRLAAVEALVRHASDPSVRRGLIASIDKQQSPLVQAAMADAMLLLQEKRSVKEFRQLLKQNGLDEDVRDKLQNTIAALS